MAPSCTHSEATAPTLLLRLPLTQGAAGQGSSTALAMAGSARKAIAAPIAVSSAGPLEPSSTVSSSHRAALAAGAGADHVPWLSTDAPASRIASRRRPPSQPPEAAVDATRNIDTSPGNPRGLASTSTPTSSPECSNKRPRPSPYSSSPTASPRAWSAAVSVGRAVCRASRRMGMAASGAVRTRSGYGYAPAVAGA